MFWASQGPFSDCEKYMNQQRPSIAAYILNRVAVPLFCGGAGGLLALTFFSSAPNKTGDAPHDQCKALAAQLTALESSIKAIAKFQAVAAEEVSLPAADTAEILNVTVAADGSIFLDGAQSDLKELRKAAASFASRNPNARAIVTVDHRLSAEKQQAGVDAVRLGGVTKYALNIQ